MHVFAALLTLSTLIVHTSSQNCSLGGYSFDDLAGKKLTAPDDAGSWEYDFQMCGDHMQCKGFEWFAIQSSVTDQTCQSGLGTWEGIALTTSANSIILEATDGADCVGTPRKLTITLTCDPSTDFKPNSAGEQGQCNFVISANSKCACSKSACGPSSSCSFLGYDLSSLSKENITLNDKNYTDFQYDVSLCQNLPYTCDDFTTGRKVLGNVYQVSRDKNPQRCWLRSSAWSANGIVAKKNTDGVTLTVMGGDKCGNGFMETEIILICKPGSPVMGYGYQDPTNKCRVVLRIISGDICQE